MCLETHGFEYLGMCLETHGFEYLGIRLDLYQLCIV